MSVLNKADRPEMYYSYGQLGDTDNVMDGERVLVSAGVAWRNPSSTDDEFTLHVPDAEMLMVDSGGFQAATRWSGPSGVPTPSMESRFPYSCERPTRVGREE